MLAIVLFLSSSAFALTLIIISWGDIASSEHDVETLLAQSLLLFFFIWLAVKSTHIYENAKYSKRDQRLQHILKRGKKAGLSSAQIHHLLLHKLKKNKHKKAAAGALGAALYHKHREYDEYDDQYSKSTLNDLFQNETDENELCLILEDIKQHTEQEARTAHYEPSYNNRSSTSSSSARCNNAVDSEDDDNTENDQNDDE
ncbi:hypothetical protein CWB96_14390 [Pseudoalteromonas citrea]|uniref:Uncharacterized protein n=1 Tax=Pseudoalteromonas citrea TaxID=43655 RepID=A0A5S3XLX4_9GAMM|nr:hypothetical protein CWB96_14390 [Pseudoalteromonas citrea]